MIVNTKMKIDTCSGVCWSIFLWLLMVYNCHNSPFGAIVSFLPPTPDEWKYTRGLWRWGPIFMLFRKKGVTGNIYFWRKLDRWMYERLEWINQPLMMKAVRVNSLCHYASGDLIIEMDTHYIVWEYWIGELNSRVNTLYIWLSVSGGYK